MTDQTRQDWLAARRQGIGGSDIAAVLGLSPYTTPYDIWLEKRRTDPPEDTFSEPAYWGTVLEDVVAKEYQRRTGRKVQRVNATLVNPEAPFARCNIDRAVINPEIMGVVRWKDGRLTTDRILECKTANAHLAKLWGEQDTDEVPEYYLTQCHWNAGTSGAEICDLPVLIGGQDYRIYSIAADAGLYADLLQIGEDFWRLVKTGVEPDPITLGDAQKRWGQHVAGKSEIVGVEVYNAARRLAEIKAQAKEIEAEEDLCKLVVMQAMGDAEIATHGGEKIATWKTQSATRLDVKAFKADHPDLFDIYATTTESRVFRLSPSMKKD